MKKSFSFTLLLLLLQLTICRAQFQADIPEAKPIPPNAASMFKVLDRPLGTFTGTIPVNVPICRVTSGPLSADVALNYTSTGGIRVEELASAVGLGFNLADGAGRITQQVKGLPDDEELGRLQTTYPKPSTYSCGNMTDLYELYSNWLDLEPDIFLYSFNGRSGKFILSETGSVILLQNDGIQITYTLTINGITAWTITDEKGNQYHYGSKITNQSSYSGSNGTTSGSVSSQSWYLTSETDMNGENQLSFSYVQTGNVFTTFSGGFMPLSLSGLICGGFNINTETGATVTTDGTEYLIDTIKGNSGYVAFNSTPQYMNGPQQLNSIQVYDSSGNLRNQFHFNYGTPFSSERLRLNSFSEAGASGSDSLSYSFTYNTFYNLPTVLSPEVDIWGFYNNSANLFGLMPALYYTNGAGLNIAWDFYGNRSANGFYAQANMLTRITYPTGGYRQFTYEGNTVLASGDFFQYHPDPAYMATRSFDQTSFTYHGPSSPSMQQLFTVSSYFGVSKLYYTLGTIGVSCSSYTVTIVKVTSPTQLTGGVTQISFNNQPAENFTLPNGYYRVDVYANSTGCTVGSLSGSWQECTLDNATESTPYGTYSKYVHNGGGVRIQQIQDYDPATGATYTRSYKYKMYSADSTLTSGLLASPVNITALQNDEASGCGYIKLCPGSSYPLSMDNGSYVVYPEVRTIDSAKGWTDELFSYVADEPDPEFPAAPPADFSYSRGRLLQQKTYRQDGTLLKKTVNAWDYGTGSYAQAVRSKAYWFHTISEDFVYREYPDVPNELPSMGDCTDYSVGMPPVVLYSSIDSLYSPAGTQVVRNLYNYYVNNGNFFLQKKIAYVNNSRTKEETYKYAFNPASSFSFRLSAAEQSMMTTLLGKNYLQPLEVVDSIRQSNGTPAFLNGSKSVFGTFSDAGTSAIHLSQFRTFSSPVDSTVMNFTTYSAKGSLAEQYKTGDVNTSYLWGYRGAYVVAKVVGSNYSTVAALVSASVLNNPSSDAAMQTQLNNIRTGLAGTSAQVTTYTYAPGYGMTSSTDPSGITTYCDYDALGRLLDVRDQNHNIIKRYNYKLAN
jgi:YD repeat-containing protein